MDAEEGLIFFWQWQRRLQRQMNQLGDFFCDAVRDPAVIFSHKSGCFAQPGSHCNCSFAMMNFTELSALDAAYTIPTRWPKHKAYSSNQII
jgi:hypothetical protein